MSVRSESAADAGGLAHLAVQRIEAWAQAALGERERFVIACSGDEAVRAACRGWAERGRADFSRVVAVAAEERALPAGDPRSTQAVLRANLVGPLVGRGLPAPASIGPDGLELGGEWESAPAAAPRGDVAPALAFDRAFGERVPGGVLDLAVLGVGVRGEIAGLAPRGPALRHAALGGLALAGAGAGGFRFTLSVNLLRAARQVLVLAAGPERAEALHQALDGRLDPEGTPAQFVLRDERVAVTLIADAAARSRLSR